MVRSVQEWLDVLKAVSVRSVWAKMPEVLVDGYGKRHPQLGEMGMIISWGAEGIGFGELTFTFNEEGSICDSETMPKEFVEAVLIRLGRDSGLHHDLVRHQNEIDKLNTDD